MLADFLCPLHSVRLLRLGPWAVIHEYTDYCLGYADGEVRLHLPIISNPAVTFMLNHRPVVMEVGEVWYLNVNQPHQVTNPSPMPPVHLVLDCTVNNWLDRQLWKGAGTSASRA